MRGSGMDGTFRAVDYIGILRESLSRIDLTDPKRRRAIYDRVVEGFEGIIESVESQNVHGDDREAHRRLLRLAVRILERDIRAQVDIFDAAYRPAEIDAALDKYRSAAARRAARVKAAEISEARRAARQDEVAFHGVLAPVERAAFGHLRERLLRMDALHAEVKRPTRKLSTVAVVRSLLIYQMQIIQAESRIALIWTSIAPAVLITIISLTYFLTGAQFVYNMDVPTFALLGCTAWIMCRQIIFRVSTSFIIFGPMFNLDGVTPLAAAMTLGILYVLIYGVVFSVLIFGGHALGMITLTTHWIPVIFMILSVSFCAFSIGLILGSVGVIWPFFLRFASSIERALQLFSSVYFISEQLPSQYKPLVLWCPLAHGFQLLRAAYFPVYPSTDANPMYFAVWTMVLAAVGLCAERLVRSRIQAI
ncbi:capsular polysaccharide transport system permease protein [Methylovirgula ligni]|uniref:Capsular polysaccharide transport system permease protein n=2 Tax=Methylovirgula ligni TaxID=569860 RepID=A0A3D9Z6D2_9HYPH|nr:capsular polysaccharide transport system permease protein [Methylovirgula ligni]